MLSTSRAKEQVDEREDPEDRQRVSDTFIGLVLRAVRNAIRIPG